MAQSSANEIVLPPYALKIVDEVMGEFGGTSPQISSGEINHVVILEDAPEQCVLKIPKYPPVRPFACRGDIINLEAEALYPLADRAADAPVEFPTVLAHDYEQPYLVLSYIPGCTLSNEQLRGLAAGARRAFLQKLVAEVVWIADAIPIDGPLFTNPFSRPLYRNCVIDKRAEIVESPGFWPQDNMLEEIGQYVLGKTAHEIYSRYHRLRNEGHIERNIAGHNDQRGANWVFDVNTLDAVFLGSVDYGNTLKTTYAQEFRLIPSLGAAAVADVAEAFYDQTGTELDISLVQFWDQAHITARAVAFWDRILKAICCGQEDAVTKLLRSELRQELTRELQRAWPSRDWGEMSGEVLHTESICAV